jgi:transposase
VLKPPAPRRDTVKFGEEVVEIVEAFDLTGSYRDAAELVGCSPTTVARYVALRGLGLQPSRRLRRAGLMDGYLEKVEEWVNASRGKVRADVVFSKLQAMGYQGSERTVRRAVKAAKEAYGQGHRRVYRPWIVEPGLWFQWDYGKGPEVEGRQTVLFCAWLAWSRYRVFIPILDRTLPTVIWCLDQALRRFGGCPTYGLSDNEKTLTVEHVAGIAIREPVMVAVGRWYGVSLRSCVPYDPESKGGSESTVRVAKADLVPTEANLLDQYSSFWELEEACRELEAEVNGREHRGTRRIPAEMVVEERARLHPLPEEPYTLAFGVARRVGQTTAMVSYEGGSYSVPEQLAGQVVWV